MDRSTNDSGGMTRAASRRRGRLFLILGILAVAVPVHAQIEGALQHAFTSGGGTSTSPSKHLFSVVGQIHGENAIGIPGKVLRNLAPGELSTSVNVRDSAGRKAG